jgi:DNA polymerase (family 10)
MPVPNTKIADIFEKLADLLEIEDANPFRVRAYRNAARTVRGWAKSMADLLDEGRDLSELPDIGKDIAGKIRTIVDTGELPLLEEVEARTPAALSDLMHIEGLGAKRVKSLYRELGIRSVGDLSQAARSGKIRRLKGFGEKIEQKIGERVEHFTRAAARTRLIDAEEIATSLLDHLRGCEGIKEVSVAGSYRRRKETVGDIDILLTAARDSPVMDHFTGYDGVAEVVSKGKTRSTVRLRSGMQVDLRFVPQLSYGAALHYFTGSREHNIAVRRLGQKQGYRINEYGVFKGHKRIAGRTERAVYAKLGLPFIPPELREDRGELDAARKRKLPKLITLDDIRGDLHCHTNATDGRNTAERMAKAAIECGYDYLAITDHTKHLTVARGLGEKRLRAQMKAIDRLNEKLTDLVVLKSAEVDILEDGTLDLPNSLLKELDVTVCAVHDKFDLPRKKQTERILRAMSNPYFNILAHPTGRLINRREPYSVDLEKLLRAAAECGCVVELNAHPDRLDLNDEGCRMAKDLGVRVAIATDSHRTSDLRYIRCGVDQARRGWLEKTDVVNTLPLNRLRKALRRH